MNAASDFTRGLSRDYSDVEVKLGILNLLVGTAEIKSGDQVLFINERSPVLEPAVADLLAAAARDLGARVTVKWADSVTAPEQVPSDVLDEVSHSPITIFNHRMATMLRFAAITGNGRRINNFAMTRAAFGAYANCLPGGTRYGVIGAVNKRLSSARTWRVTCADGTDLSGSTSSPASSGGGVPAAPMPTFPAGVHRPVSCLQGSGRLSVRWLVCGGMHVFDPSSVTLDSPVLLVIENGHITGTSGDRQSIDKLKWFLNFVGTQVHADGFIVNSWHAGVNGEVQPTPAASQDIEAWFALAHTSSRVVHFHAVDKEIPGELSLPCVDPTIVFDNEVLWDRGRLVLPEAVHAGVVN